MDRVKVDGWTADYLHQPSSHGFTSDPRWKRDGRQWTPYQRGLCTNEGLWVEVTGSAEQPFKRSHITEYRRLGGLDEWLSKWVNGSSNDYGGQRDVVGTRCPILCIKYLVTRLVLVCLEICTPDNQCSEHPYSVRMFL